MKKRNSYRWNERQIGVSWLMVTPDLRERNEANAIEIARSAFRVWRSGDRRRAALTLDADMVDYCGPASAGRTVRALRLTLRGARPTAMASVYARREARAAGIPSGSPRTIYDWRAIHGHTLTLPTSTTDDAIRQSWQAWKRRQVDTGAWTPEEATQWRGTIDRARGAVTARVIDSRIEPPTLPLSAMWRAEHGAEIVLPVARLAGLPQSWNAWKRERRDSKVWTENESGFWRYTVTAEGGQIRVRIVDSRIEPPLGARAFPPPPAELTAETIARAREILDAQPVPPPEPWPDIQAADPERAPPAPDDPTSPDYW